MSLEVDAGEDARSFDSALVKECDFFHTANRMSS
jgi:hypothetical protein